MKYRKLTIYLDKELVKEINEIAKELGKEKDHIIRDALIHYFDYLDVKIAEKRLEAIKKGKEETISLEEAIKELGLKKND